MAVSNFERMMQLAEEVFDTKNDAEQLDVDENVIEHLLKIHPATVSELKDENGPVAWVIIIPTTQDLMHQFLKKEISEKELFELTPINVKYDALYLCSAMVLEEYRRKGIAKKLVMEALEKIRKEHNIKALFAWTFSQEGELAAKALATLTSLPLYFR